MASFVTRRNKGVAEDLLEWIEDEDEEEDEDDRGIQPNSTESTFYGRINACRKLQVIGKPAARLRREKTMR